MVAGDGEGHQLFERHLVGGIEVKELGRDGGELQPLSDDRGADEEAGRDLLFAETLLAQGLEGAELVERVQRDTVHVLGERVLRGEAFGADDARHQLGLRHPLLLD